MVVFHSHVNTYQRVSLGGSAGTSLERMGDFRPVTCLDRIIQNICSCLMEWAQQHQAFIFFGYLGKFDLARKLDDRLGEANLNGFDRLADPISPQLA